jgi:acyl transferase domain-containing protein/thioesterase domain-containing protein/acyl carrier protein
LRKKTVGFKTEKKGIPMTGNREQTGLEIAVIGITGRFPGAKDINQFWNNLKNGVETISFFTHKQLEEEGVDPGLLKDPNYVKAKSMIDDADCFDAPFFDYTPKKAEVMDPQVRLFHECAWEALENAGYNPLGYKGLIGMYAGASPHFNWEALSVLSGKSKQLGFYASSQLSDKDFLSTRISFKLNLRGPSVSIQTACSTSLVAIHMACQALLNGECHMALAGGVTVTSQGSKGYYYQEGMILSPDGHCRAFDAKAKGTVPGNGIGIVVLKLLEDALADRDYIYAVVKSSVVNNDGLEKAGYTAPSRMAQTHLLKVAWQMAEVDPESITYIETHGTGTTLGDPIEIDALKQAFDTTKQRFCAIGSVKTNIGHLDAAAGVAGFIKTVLALKHRQIPPSLHFESPNPVLGLDNSPFYVNTTLKEWKREKFPLRAGVSSFGIGGTNAHVVLEEAPEPVNIQSQQERDRKYQLILLSAKTIPALNSAAGKLVEYLETNPGIDIADAAYTLQVGRSAFNHRRMTVCSSTEEAIKNLSSPLPGKCQFSCSNDNDNTIVFMFPGQGSQYVNMGRELFQTETVFRDVMTQCFEILKPIIGYDLKQVLYPPVGHSLQSLPGINRTEVAQPLLFVFEYALAKLLLQWGITPCAMIGHSIGQYTAACLSGVFSLQETLRLVAHRGKLVQKMTPGSMLSVPIPEDTLAPLLNKKLSLAAVNSSSRCVVSGPDDAAADFEKQLKNIGFECKRLNTSHAFHSHMMTPVLKEFESCFRGISPGKPTIPFISNVNGQWITPEEGADPSYWANHLRKTVRFSDGLEELFKKGHTFFIEVGPGKALTTFVKQHKNRGTEHAAVNIVNPPGENKADLHFLLNQIGQLWLRGLKIDWAAFHAGEKRHRMPLPSYAFDRHLYRVEKDIFELGASLLSQKSLSAKKKSVGEWFYLPSWERSLFPANPGIARLSPLYCLVFCDAYGLGDRLVKKLKQDTPRVITVHIGQQFSKLSDNAYIVNPGHCDDYYLLMSELHIKKTACYQVLHLWSVTGESNGEPGFQQVEKKQEQGFFSLIYLAQAIKKQRVSGNFYFTVISNQIHEVVGGETLCPGKATVLGPCKVLPQEYPNVRFKSIDIVLPTPGSKEEEKLLDRLIGELSEKSSDTVIAYRENFRWVQTYKSINADRYSQYDILLKDGGVYLITGGLGAIGLTLASCLADSRKKTKLVLVGRSFFPGKEEWEKWLASHDIKEPISRKIRKIQEIETLGAEVAVRCADVGNLARMQDVLDETEKTIGPINGIIHAAGIIGDSTLCSFEYIDNKTHIEQFRAKIYGTLVLEKLMRGKNLDFCILMSSLSSILGGLGFAVYSAANIFMDAFVYYCSKTQTGDWITINWDGWEFREALPGSPTGTDTLYITPEEGINAFKTILAMKEVNHVIVSPLDLRARLEKWITFDSEEKSGTTHKSGSALSSRSGLSNSYVEPRTELEKKITIIWEEYLGFKQVGIYDDLFELGGDSLLAVQLISKLNATFQIDLASHLLLKNPTIAAAAEQIEKYVSTNDPLHSPGRKTLPSLLVEIQKGNPGTPPVFLVHPIGGHVYIYHDLVTHLGPETTVYGLQSRGLDGIESPLHRVEDMAENYITAMKEVQPDGPYLLGGASFGGVVAFEMAQQLSGSGQDVGLLAMIDAPGPGHMPIKPKDDADILAYILTVNNRKLDVSADYIRTLNPDEQLKYFFDHSWFQHKVDFETAKKMIQYFLQVFKANLMAMFQYTPGPYAGQIVYFSAEQQKSIYGLNPEQAWTGMAEGGMEIHKVSGDHITMNQKTNVQTIAHVLKTYVK